MFFCSLKTTPPNKFSPPFLFYCLAREYESGRAISYLWAHNLPKLASSAALPGFLCTSLKVNFKYLRTRLVILLNCPRVASLMFSSASTAFPPKLPYYAFSTYHSIQLLYCCHPWPQFSHALIGSFRRGGN